MMVVVVVMVVEVIITEESLDMKVGSDGQILGVWSKAAGSCSRLDKHSDQIFPGHEIGKKCG